MKAIEKTFSCLFLIILVGYISGISRSGYRVENNPEVYSSDCKVSIQYQAKFNENEVEMLGRIKAFDTLFSVKCYEAFILEKFAREACILGADVINIIKEKHPDILSTCYRAEAEFLRFFDREMAKKNTSSPKYETEQIIERSQEAARRNKRDFDRITAPQQLSEILIK